MDYLSKTAWCPSYFFWKTNGTENVHELPCDIWNAVVLYIIK